ncbi:MAG: hypothetical protein KAR79_02250 [Simkaniaceae bacterium]|nr:hypothetical protein [Simkaniaceae bacterium]
MQISCKLAVQFMNLSQEQKNEVYGVIYDLSLQDGIFIPIWDHRYGEYHVFDDSLRLEKALKKIGQ